MGPTLRSGVGNGLFCSIAQIYFQGITFGVTPTTYDPTGNVRRDQMAAFLARTENVVLQRGSRRAALKQFWTATPQYTITQGSSMLGTTTVGDTPTAVAADGADLWVANNGSGTVSRVRASDGKLLETWTGADSAADLVVAMGRVFVTGATNPGKLYVIEPSQPQGAVTTLSSALVASPGVIAFDGQRLWTTHANGSISIITPGAPFSVSNVGGFGDLRGIVYDGANIWVTEYSSPGKLKKLNASGTVLTTVTVSGFPLFPTYDGTNLWVPNSGDHKVSVVRPSDGMVLATLTDNGLESPFSAAFDGQRVLVTNTSTVSLFRAADLTPLGTFTTGSILSGLCSDGLNFWIVLQSENKLGRF
jgi:hypothetical protein